MNASNFDKFTRTFGRASSRRGLLAFAGGLLSLRSFGPASAAAPAAQLTPDACASTGQVCTLLRGCCTGLSCATSAINPSYGVCVPGDGGMVSAGTALVVPFDEEDAATAAPVTENTSSTTTTDPQAEREQELAERKARREAHKNRIEARKDDRKDRKDEQRDRKELARGPELEFRLDKESDPETLKVINRDNQSIVLTGIEPLSDASGLQNMTPPETLTEGEPFLFVSELAPDGESRSDNRFKWIGSRVCGEAAGDGFLVYAAFTSNSETFEYEVLCDGPPVVTFTHGSNKQRNQGQNDNRKRKRRKSQHKKKKGDKR